MKRSALCIVALASLIAPSLSFAQTIETRYHQYFWKQMRTRPVVAGHFGSAGVEELVQVGFTDKGQLLAVGNAWGPEFPDVKGVEVLGEDRRVDAPAVVTDKKGRQSPDYGCPNASAFALRLGSKYDRIEAAVRLGWGNASVVSATVGSDGAVYFSGPCQPAFVEWAKGGGAELTEVSPPEGKGGGADLYLAKLSPKFDRLEWVFLFREASAASAAAERHVSRRPSVRCKLRAADELLLVAYDRLYVVGVDGKGLRELGATRGGVLLTVDPADGACYLGGDQNSHTGREPWRRPFLCKFDREGQLVWELWRWDPKRVGTDKYRLESDSSVRHAVLGPTGKLCVSAWTDGGNSVFNREPADLDIQVKYGFIDSLWGAGVGSFARLMRIDPNSREFLGGTLWCSFLTRTNKPNSSVIEDLAYLEDGRLAVVGSSSFALVETPDAWVRTFPEGTGGSYLAIFNPDLDSLDFCTVLPNLDRPLSLAVHGNRLAVAGRAVPRPEEGRSTLLRGKLGQAFGGMCDGYLLVAETRPVH